MGYTASLCEVPVDNVCDSNPCRNGGSCHLSSLSNYTCTCPVGWKGKLVTFFARKRTVTCRLLWIESVTEYYIVRYLYVHILLPYGFLSVSLLFVLKNIKWGFFVFLLLGKCFLSQKQHLFALYSCCRYRYLLLYIFQCCKPYLEFWLNLDSDLACMVTLSILNNCTSGGGRSYCKTVKWICTFNISPRPRRAVKRWKKGK